MKILLFLFLFWLSLLAEDSTVCSDTAIGGYDVVTYYSGKPQKGNVLLSYQFDDQLWFFSSEKNRELFIEDPHNYLPEYGSYCSYGMRFSLTVDPEDYRFYSIVNNKLYFNFDEKIQKRWNKRNEYYIRKADKRWLKRLTRAQ